MTKKTPQKFNILIIGQGGRIGYEAILLASSLRESSPNFKGRLIVGEPQPGPLWSEDPRMSQEQRDTLEMLGAEVIPFDNDVFGESYPHGNKIEALKILPPKEPFLFLDSDTLITGDIESIPFDFDSPSASMRRTGTWPVEELYWEGYGVIWKSLYDKFGLDYESSLDMSQPDEHWERYMYFNAGWFFGASPKKFAKKFLKFATAIRDDAPTELEVQPLYPWLDQIALPLVIHALGGGRPGPELAGLDGHVTCHYRTFPLAYARESDEVIAMLENIVQPNKVKKVVKQHEALRRIVLQGKGEKIRAIFDRNNLPESEEKIRKILKNRKLWMR